MGGYTLQLQLGEKTVLSHRLHALFIFAPAAENCKVQREIQMSCVHKIEMHLQFPHNIFAVRRLLSCVRSKKHYVYDFKNFMALGKYKAAGAWPWTTCHHVYRSCLNAASMREHFSFPPCTYTCAYHRLVAECMLVWFLCILAACQMRQSRLAFSEPGPWCA